MDRVSVLLQVARDGARDERVANLGALIALDVPGLDELLAGFVRDEDREVRMFVCSQLAKRGLYANTSTHDLIYMLVNKHGRRSEALMSVLCTREDTEEHALEELRRQDGLSFTWTARLSSAPLLVQLVYCRRAIRSGECRLDEQLAKARSLPEGDRRLYPFEEQSRELAFLAVIGELRALVSQHELLDERTWDMIVPLLTCEHEGVKMFALRIISQRPRQSFLSCLKPLEKSYIPLGEVVEPSRGALWHRKVKLIKLCKRLLSRMFSFLHGEERYVALRALLSLGPSPEVWKGLCILLEQWARSGREVLEPVISYVSAHIAHWPDELRVAPTNWWCWRGEGLFLPWSLVRVIRFHSTEPFHFSWFRDDFMERLWRQSDTTTHCAHLDLACTYLGPEKIKALCQCEELRSIDYLDLTRTEMGHEGVEALAMCPYLSNVRVLDVTGNGLKRASWDVLFSSPYLQEVQIITDSVKLNGWMGNTSPPEKYYWQTLPLEDRPVSWRSS
ncbi:MAG: hypothetical protein CL920_27080 [Deltaproteobacteria bacterium]|nr:hypothetical protein [Deltaproteobacteria bacterium]MBU52374.1 hypothetical protein [Deltaproteobacteria bacterium]